MPERDAERFAGISRGSLDGVCVMVTRPQELAQGLVKLIEQEGGRALCFPALELAEVESSPELALLIERLEGYDLAIFVSPSAVVRGLASIRRRREWPATLPSAAIGEGTAQALRQHRLEVALTAPSPFSSEALLELAALQRERVRARRIVIFRGQGGSTLLGDTLRARGAEVDYAEVYRRVRPCRDVAPVLTSGEVDVVVVTSGEALRNLFEMAGIGGHASLCQTPFVVISKRLAELARERGARAAVAVAPRASDEGLCAALQVWRAAWEGQGRPGALIAAKE